MEFLRDPIWQFAGAIIGIAAIIASLYILDFIGNSDMIGEC